MIIRLIRLSKMPEFLRDYGAKLPEMSFAKARVDYYCHRSVIDERHLHVGPEHTSFHILIKQRGKSFAIFFV